MAIALSVGAARALVKDRHVLCDNVGTNGRCCGNGRATCLPRLLLQPMLLLNLLLILLSNGSRFNS